jgi:hypothetical protein
MTRTCQTTVADCRDQAVTTAWWSCGCTLDYCPRHRDRALKGVVNYCHLCGTRPIRVVEMRLKLTAYETAREKLLEADWRRDGFLELKEALVAAVTLDEPPDWDTFGSIMAAEPPPKPVPLADRTLASLAAAQVGRVPVAPFIIAALIVILFAQLGFFS